MNRIKWHPLDDDDFIAAWAYSRQSKRLFLRFRNRTTYRFDDISRYSVDQFKANIETGLLSPREFFNCYWKDTPNQTELLNY